MAVGHDVPLSMPGCSHDALHCGLETPPDRYIHTQYKSNVYNGLPGGDALSTGKEARFADIAAYKALEGRPRYSRHSLAISSVSAI